MQKPKSKAVKKKAAPPVAQKESAKPPAAPKPKPAAQAAAAPISTPPKKVQAKDQQQAEEEEVEAAGEDGEFIPYELLKARTFNRSDVDIKNLENYLSPAEFQKIFNMSKEKFGKLKGWKRVQLKKRHKLF